MDLTRTEQMLLQAIKAALCETHVDWADETPQELDGLMHLALQHKLQPLVLQAIYDCPAAKAWPALEQSRSAAKAQVMAQTAKTAEFLALYQTFGDAGCAPLVVKGILCRDLYPNGDLRQSGDEDLFAAPQQFSDCCRVLRENGFAPFGQADIDTADEIGWKKPGSVLRIELHRSLFTQTTEAVKDLQSLFADGFNTQETYLLASGNSVCSMSKHDHLLYLLLHAYKHFIRGGFGIRQVCDIGLWAKKYNAAIDWEKLFSQAEQTNTVKFSAAVFRIAKKNLGIDVPLPPCWQNVRIDEQPMLKDLLSAGIYGTATGSRTHAARVTQDAVSAGKTRRKGGFLHAVFPSREALMSDYPELKEKRYRLPVVWIKRLRQYAGSAKKKEAFETVRLARERKKLLKTYDII